MGKSLKGKELGKGISQRADGRYQARFTNRFGKRQSVYGKTYNEVIQLLRKAQIDDENEVNVVSKDITLDEWFAFKECCKADKYGCHKRNYK